jgi:chitinase
MAYDVYATWSNVGAGPNAPLQDSCAPTKNQLGSCASFVKAWTDAGIPANQVLLGVPSYGRSYTLTTPIDGDAQKLASFPAFNQDKVPFGTYDTPDSGEPFTVLSSDFSRVDMFSLL